MRSAVLIAIALSLGSSGAEAQFRKDATPVLWPVEEGVRPVVRHLPFFQQTCEEATAQGRADASQTHSSSGWMLGGVGSGLLLGVIGMGVITAVAASSNPQPLTVPEAWTDEQSCYRDGYRSKAKGKNTTSALAGGALGTAAWILVLVIATSGG
jgi:hypothetical protein